MNILVVGAGYVGLVSGTCFAELGNRVVCIDIDEKKINSLQSGKIPFYEPELEDLVYKNIKTQSLSFSTNLSEHIHQTDLVLICVGTPPRQTGQADLRYIFQAAEDIGKNLQKYTVIATKSTVPVGTGQRIKKIISKNYNGEFEIASCPEFLREGSAVKDFMNPDRIIIGTENQKAAHLLIKLHEKLSCPKLTTTLETAEMIKYAANAFLATKISFINEIANVCENVGADVEQVAEGMGLDKRIGRAFLNAGIGYGGSCFPKDVRALHHVAGQTGYPFQLLKAVVEVNNQQRWLFYKKVKDELQSLENKTIAIWGLSFKSNTDDVRESIAIDIIEKLVEDGAIVKAYDPEAMKNTQKILGDKIQYCFTAEFALENADCLLIITDWEEFKQIDVGNIKGKMKTPLVIDGRNMFNCEKLSNQGIKYISIGR